MKKAGIPNKFGRTNAEYYKDFKDEYEIYGAGVKVYYGDYGEGECDPLRWFYEAHEYDSGPLVGDDLILIHCSLD